MILVYIFHLKWKIILRILFLYYPFILLTEVVLNVETTALFPFRTINVIFFTVTMTIIFIKLLKILNCKEFLMIFENY